MSHCKLTSTHDCPDAILQDSLSWSRIAVYEDLLCREKIQLSEGLVTAVIHESSIEMSRHVNIPVLMKYMLKRHLITRGEQWALTEKPLAPNEKVLQLQQILSRKGEQGLTEFYLCLLESYLAEGGVSSHYILANAIKRKIRFKCGVNPELFKQDGSSIIPRIKPLPLSLECAERLLHNLGISDSDNIPNNPTTQDVCQCWLSANQSGDWTDLVEAFLTEPGLGWCVSETLPISSSNPPAVCDYVRSLLTDWVCFAHHLGFPQCLIDEIQNPHEYDPQAQIQAFLRSCRIPDCGQGRTKTIMHKVSQLVQLPEVKPKQLLHKKQIGHFNRVHESDDCQDKELMGMLPKNMLPKDMLLKDIPPQLLADAILLVQQKATSGHSLQGGASPAVNTAYDHNVHSPIPLSDRNPFPKWDDAGLEMMAVYQTKKQQSQPLHHGNTVEEKQQNQTLPLGNTVEEKQQNQTLQHGKTVEIDENDGKGLLQNCVSGWWDMSMALIKSGSKLDARTKNGRTSLHICCMKGGMPVIKLLLDYNAEVSITDNDGNTPLHLKQTLKNLPLVELLVGMCVKQGKSVDLLNKSGQSPLMLACQEGHICYKAACVFLTHGASPNGPFGAQSRPLIYACETGDTRLVDLLLSKGTDINGQDKERSTPLIQACLCNHTGIAVKLLERGADPQKADMNGTTALAAAVSKNSYEVVQLLITKGANVNSCRYIVNEITQGHVEETPLASACGHGFRPIAELLIENGAKIDYLCSGQVPPIGFAIICKKQHMVKFMTQLNEYKSIYRVLLPMQIAMNDHLQNYEAARILLDALGGPEQALQEARDKQLHQLEEDIQVLMAVTEGRYFQMSDNESPSGSNEPQAIRNHRTKMEEILQRFSQITMSAVTANRDCESFVSIATAFDAPHVAMLFRDYYEYPPRPDKLKAKFLGREHGLSPFNFLLKYHFLDAVQFQVHALQFYPEGPDEFYLELVSAFHQIPGGEDLPWEVQSVLQQLFDGRFQLNIDTTAAASDQVWECQTPHGGSLGTGAGALFPDLQPVPKQERETEFMKSVADPFTEQPTGTIHVSNEPGASPKEHDESINESPKLFISGAGEGHNLPNHIMKPGVKGGTSSPELGKASHPEQTQFPLQQDESTGDSPKTFLPSGRESTKHYVQQQAKPQVKQVQMNASFNQHPVCDPTADVEDLSSKVLPGREKDVNSYAQHSTLPIQRDESSGDSPRTYLPSGGKPNVLQPVYTQQPETGETVQQIDGSAFIEQPAGIIYRKTCVGDETSSAESVEMDHPKQKAMYLSRATSAVHYHELHSESSDSSDSLTQQQSHDRKQIQQRHHGNFGRQKSMPPNLRQQNPSTVMKRPSVPSSPTEARAASKHLHLPSKRKPSKIPLPRWSRQHSYTHQREAHMQGPAKQHKATGFSSPTKANTISEPKVSVIQTCSTGVFLGNGAYGSVTEVKDDSGMIYAAKKYHVIDRRQSDFWSGFLQEYKILIRLNHPNIVQYKGLSLDHYNPLLLMERMKSNLSERLLDHSTHMVIHTKLSILLDVAEGLTYLHCQKPAIIHRDLTAKNVLLDTDMVAKIGDFGNARIADIETGGQISTTRLPGTQLYMPPEACLTSHAKYSKKLDIFSFGHLGLFTTTQQVPNDLLPATYDHYGQLLGRTEVKRRKKFFDILHRQFDRKHPLTLLIKLCLDNKADMRPTASGLVSTLESITAKVTRY